MESRKLLSLALVFGLSQTGCSKTADFEFGLSSRIIKICTNEFASLPGVDRARWTRGAFQSGDPGPFVLSRFDSPFPGYFTAILQSPTESAKVFIDTDLKSYCRVGARGIATPTSQTDGSVAVGSVGGSYGDDMTAASNSRAKTYSQMTSPPGGKQSFSVLSSKPVSSGEPEFEWVRSSEGRVVVSVRLFEGTGGTENCSSPIASVADHRVIKTGIEVFFRWRRRGCKASWRRIVFDFAWKETTPPVVNWDVGPESGCVSYRVQKDLSRHPIECSPLLLGKYS
jgi:hypothetical protein